MACAAAAGPPIPPDTPLKLLDPTGSPVRNDNLTNYAYVGNGNGTTPPELYLAYHATNLADTAPIQPGQTTKLQNEEVRVLPERPLARLLPAHTAHVLQHAGGQLVVAWAAGWTCSQGCIACCVLPPRPGARCTWHGYCC